MVNADDWRRGYWTMAQIRANDEQVLTTQSTTCISQLMMMTKIFQRRSYDGLNSMTFKNRHWYDVTDGSETNLEITTESKESKTACKWCQRQYPLSRYSLQQSRRQCIYHYLKKRVRKHDKTWDPNLKNPVKFRYTNWDLHQSICHEARLSNVFSLNKTFGENKRQENPI